MISFVGGVESLKDIRIVVRGMDIHVMKIDKKRLLVILIFNPFLKHVVDLAAIPKYNQLGHFKTLPETEFGFYPRIFDNRHGQITLCSEMFGQS